MNRILVIDDEDWLREMVQLALEGRGFQVLQAENGAKGVEVARRELPDLILCDVNMNQLDGYGTLSSLRSEPMTAAIPFILMTGLADNRGMRQGMELGADDYLPKPFTLDNLFAAVDARLRKAQAMRQLAERKLADLRDNISFMLPHELRTPLNGIMAYGELLANDSESLTATEIAEMGKVIFDSGSRLQRLVENFLVYAQIELLATDSQKVLALRTKRTAAPGKVVEQRASNVATEANRDADLLLDVTARSPLAVSDDYLARIVDELVQNAFKFSSPGTPVCVGLSELPEIMVLTVTDKGRGFSTENITRVGAYMQFDRKLHEQQGLGLGLSIAKRLVELHGGALTIQSERGVQTAVTVRLPKALAN